MSLELGIVWPALLAGLLVTATHVPLGVQVLNRGIVFIDLAVAQIAGLGVIVADALGFEHHGLAVQVAALTAALAGALLLNWTDKRWPAVQEAVIGVTFIVAANAAILLLAADAHGAEHLKELLIGQILWVKASLLPYVAVIYGVLLFAWLRWAERMGRIGFYVLFAVAVTISVQLVGVYLVFATLIVPALATMFVTRRRTLAAYAIGAAGYATGLALSLATDLPPGPLIVCCLTALGVVVILLRPRSRIPT